MQGILENSHQVVTHEHVMVPLDKVRHAAVVIISFFLLFIIIIIIIILAAAAASSSAAPSPGGVTRSLLHVFLSLSLSCPPPFLPTFPLLTN
jgi:hypothetical protein